MTPTGLNLPKTTERPTQPEASPREDIMVPSWRKPAVSFTIPNIFQNTLASNPTLKSSKDEITDNPKHPETERLPLHTFSSSRHFQSRANPFFFEPVPSMPPMLVFEAMSQDLSRTNSPFRLGNTSSETTTRSSSRTTPISNSPLPSLRVTPRSSEGFSSPSLHRVISLPRIISDSTIASMNTSTPTQSRTASRSTNQDDI